MLAFLFFLSLVSAHFRVLAKQDLKLSTTSPGHDLEYDNPFLIFLHFQKEGFSCPLCVQYKVCLYKINVPVRELNFAKNVELGSRFLQHTFPVFIIRYRNASYVLEPQTEEDLIDIVNNERWRKLAPVRAAVDVNSFFAIAFSKANRIIFYGIDAFHFTMKYTPDYAVSGFTMAIIAYLIYSIVDVLSMRDEKVKEE